MAELRFGQKEADCVCVIRFSFNRDQESSFPLSIEFWFTHIVASASSKPSQEDEWLTLRLCARMRFWMSTIESFTVFRFGCLEIISFEGVSPIVLTPTTCESAAMNTRIVKSNVCSYWPISRLVSEMCLASLLGAFFIKWGSSQNSRSNDLIAALQK